MGPRIKEQSVEEVLAGNSQQEADRENADDLAQLHNKEIKAFHLVKLGCIWLIPFVAAAIIIAFTLNILLPHGWRWLTPTDLSGLQSLVISIVSGIVTSVAVNYFTKNNQAQTPQRSLFSEKSNKGIDFSIVTLQGVKIFFSKGKRK